MKQSLAALAFGLVLLACSDPSDPSPDGGDPPTDDAGNLQPDARIGPSDINPPLTPDDPCRQLKYEFEDVTIRAADVIQWGPRRLVVAYQTSTAQAGLLVYRDEILTHQWSLGLGIPRLYYSRGELHVAVLGGSGQPIMEVLEREAPVRVMDEAVLDGSNYVETFETVERDFILANGSRNVARIAVNSIENTVLFSVDDGSGHRAATGVWAVRNTATPVPTFRVAAVIASGNAFVSQYADVPIVNTVEPVVGLAVRSPSRLAMPTEVSMVMDAAESAVLAIEERVDVDAEVDAVQYVRHIPGGVLYDNLLVSSGALLQGLGVLTENGRVPFVEVRPDEGGLSYSWHVVDPVRAETLTVARVGMVARKQSPSPMHAIGNKVMWAGPTIRDENTPVFPADAIAVCSYTVGE